jgi:uncharacterized protein (DUF1684 family)
MLRPFSFFIVVFVNTLSMPISMSVSTDSARVSHEEEVRAWHERRIRNLLSDHGWLTLVALDWLNEGPNKIRDIGVLTLHNGSVFLQLNAGVQATVDGKPFASGTLTPQGGPAAPDTVVIGSRSFIIIKRGERYAVRMWDTEAAARKHFTGIERFPVASKWRVEARWQPYEPPKKMSVPTVIPGYEEVYPVPGVAVFELDGNEYRLEPVLEEPDGDYFFIFGDQTNGRETYGAGRFLYASPAKHGKVILDFNKSYNPPCAFSEYTTCPLPPPQNTLPFRIEAGEKAYKSH